MVLHREGDVLSFLHTKMKTVIQTILASQLLDQTVFSIMLVSLLIHLRLLVFLMMISEVPY